MPNGALGSNDEATRVISAPCADAAHASNRASGRFKPPGTVVATTQGVKKRRRMKASSHVAQRLARQRPLPLPLSHSRSRLCQPALKPTGRGTGKCRWNGSSLRELLALRILPAAGAGRRARLDELRHLRDERIELRL